MRCSVLILLAVVAYFAEEARSQGFGASTFEHKSCAGQCGMSARGIGKGTGRKCRCDSSCDRDSKRRNRRNRKPCCKDYAMYCENSCIPRCGQQHSALFPCQCFDGCNATNSCCSDYKMRCVDKIMPTTEPLVTERNLVWTTPPPPPRRMEEGYSSLKGKWIICPDGVRFTPCPINPCKRKCPLFPRAHCRVDQCGRCKGIFSKEPNGEALECYPPERRCPGGVLYKCRGLDLCGGTDCPGFTRAKCVPNRCGGCYYDFVDEKGNVVDCEIEGSTQ